MPITPSASSARPGTERRDQYRAGRRRRRHTMNVVGSFRRFANCFFPDGCAQRRPLLNKHKQTKSAHCWSVGIGWSVGIAGAAAPTVRAAEAVPPVPPSTDVTAPDVLFFVPALVPVTLTLKIHEAFDASVAPVKFTLPEPLVAVTVPPPQLPVRPFGVATRRPAGSESVKPTPLSAAHRVGIGQRERQRRGPRSRRCLSPRTPWRSSAARHAGGATTTRNATAIPARAALGRGDGARGVALEAARQAGDAPP